MSRGFITTWVPSIRIADANVDSICISKESTVWLLGTVSLFLLFIAFNPTKLVRSMKNWRIESINSASSGYVCHFVKLKLSIKVSRYGGLDKHFNVRLHFGGHQMFETKRKDYLSSPPPAHLKIGQWFWLCTGKSSGLSSKFLSFLPVLTLNTLRTSLLGSLGVAGSTLLKVTRYFSPGDHCTTCTCNYCCSQILASLLLSLLKTVLKLSTIIRQQSTKWSCSNCHIFNRINAIDTKVSLLENTMIYSFDD